MQTKLQILKVAHKLFLQKGYKDVYVKTIAKELDISPGSVTFHYPTKEHILAEFIQHLFDFQWSYLNQGIEQNEDLICSYCLEQISMAWICENNPNVRDMYLSAYQLAMPHSIIRSNNIGKAKEIFGVYCSDWTDKDYAGVEIVVSGIEYGMMRTECTEGIDFEDKMKFVLQSLLKQYNVPQEIREKALRDVFQKDYKNAGENVFEAFSEYIDSVYR